MKTTTRKNHRSTKVIVAIFASLLVLATTSARQEALAGPAAPSVSMQASIPNQSQPDAALGSGFTYQGQLKDGGNPANGQYDFQFKLYDASSGGVQVGSTLTVLNQMVSTGLLTVMLDFGTTSYQGQGRWLEIAVRTAGGGTYTTLSPRQALTATPYAASVRPNAVITGTGNVLSAISNTGSQQGAGVYGVNTGSNGVGVLGEANNGGTAMGVWGSSTIGVGVFGSSSSSVGVAGLSDSSYGVQGISSSSVGVHGSSSSGFGVYGSSSSNWAIKGNGVSGVWGVATASNGTGVSGDATGGVGVHGVATTGWAGWFDGNVNVTGSCCAAGMGTFKIDHPTDPQGKYLMQAAMQSPDLKTIYDGNVILDGKGEAVVELPDYFEALNRDFRYQFAPIGSPMPNLYIAAKVKNNHFKIAGGKPGGEVSWQVTGIRHDPFAEAHPIQVEVEKSADEQGKYLHPTEYGQPESMGIDYEEQQRLQQQPSTPQASKP